MNKRKLKSILFFSVCIFAVVISVSLLSSIIIVIFAKGAPAITIDFLTQEMKEGGQKGGIFYQIIGTLILLTGAAVLSLPIALCASIYHAEYVTPALRRVSAILIYALNGVPAILFGLFGYIIFGVYFGWGISWLTGVFILATMILPILVVSIKHAIESIPLKYREAALSLGFTRWQLIRAVLIPQSFFGIITGLLLGLSRAAGTTAAIMFTATTFYGGRMPLTFSEPVATLQTYILVLSQEAINPLSRMNAWGAVLVLIIIVFLFNIGAMHLRTKMIQEENNEGGF